MKAFLVFFRLLMLSVLIIHIVSCEEEQPLEEFVVNNQSEEKETAVRQVSLEEFCPNANHSHAVDLGLSVKWSCCNVEAKSPEEFGGHYAWGETEVKYDYSWYTYKYCKGKYYTMTKYCTNPIYAFETVDDKITLEIDDDAACVKCGGNWRMPTVEEIEELCEKCQWEWVSFNGVNGQKVTGPNGNSIFLPAAGCHDYMDVFFSGSQGHYWSSTLKYGQNENLSYTINFKGSHREWSVGSNRSFGHSIRPVEGYRLKN